MQVSRAKITVIEIVGWRLSTMEGGGYTISLLGNSTDVGIGLPSELHSQLTQWISDEG